MAPRPVRGAQHAGRHHHRDLHAAPPTSRVPSLSRTDRPADPVDLDLHLVVDNYATHKTPAVKRWRKAHLRFDFHFTPTSASWLNMVERFFAEITRNRIRRGASHRAQQRHHGYLEKHNADPKPFIWDQGRPRATSVMCRGMKSSIDRVPSLSPNYRVARSREAAGYAVNHDSKAPVDSGLHPDRRSEPAWLFISPRWSQTLFDAWSKIVVRRSIDHEGATASDGSGLSRFSARAGARNGFCTRESSHRVAQYRQPGCRSSNRRGEPSRTIVRHGPEVQRSLSQSAWHGDADDHEASRTGSNSRNQTHYRQAHRCRFDRKTISADPQVPRPGIQRNRAAKWNRAPRRSGLFTERCGAGPHEQGKGITAPYGPYAVPPRGGDVAVIPIIPCFSSITGTRAGGFVLTRQEPAGKWGVATYSFVRTGGAIYVRAVPWTRCFELRGQSSHASTGRSAWGTLAATHGMILDVQFN
jgi:DDE superfamily endonuclease